MQRDAVTTVDPKISTHVAGDWTIFSRKHHILPSTGHEREDFEKCLELPSLPEMIFDTNCLRITYNGSSAQCAPSIEFGALDALKLVDSKHVNIEVPIAKDWRESRIGQGGLLETAHPYDWTFTTAYTGTIIGSWSISPSETGLDEEFLLRRDPILFYQDITLYEDELGDNGIATLNVKVRVMKSGFLVLQRFFLRVDGGLVRANDTRIQWRTGDRGGSVGVVPFALQCVLSNTDIAYSFIVINPRQVSLDKGSMQAFISSSMEEPCLRYLVRDIRRAESESWLPTMMGVGAAEAETVCTTVLEHRSEHLVPSGI